MRFALSVPKKKEVLALMDRFLRANFVLRVWYKNNCVVWQTSISRTQKLIITVYYY